MTQPEQEAREMLSITQADRVAAASLFASLHGDNAPGKFDMLSGKADSDLFVQAFAAHRAARPTAGIDREERAIVRDFFACLTDGGKNRVGTLFINHDELAALVERSRAILALFPTGAKTGERGAVIEECARVCDRFEQGCEPFISHASLPLTPANLKANKQAMCRDMARAIRALSQPMPDAPIVSGEG